MFTKTAYVTPRQVVCKQGKSTAMRATDCSPGMVDADNCVTPDVAQAAQATVTPFEAMHTAGGGSPGEWLQHGRRQQLTATIPAGRKQWTAPIKTDAWKLCAMSCPH